MEKVFMSLLEANELLLSLRELVDSSGDDDFGCDEVRNYGELVKFFDFLISGNTVLVSGDVDLGDVDGGLVKDLGTGVSINGMKHEMLGVLGLAMLRDNALAMLVLKSAAFFLNEMLALDDEDDKLNRDLGICVEILLGISDQIEKDLDELNMGVADDALGALLRDLGDISRNN
jgi:hypothetical protein